MKSNLVDIEMKLHHVTDKAILVSDTGDKDDAVWLPLSQVEYQPDGNWAIVTLPEWLALDKELI